MIVRKKNNILSKEFIQFYSLFLLTIFFVYYSPPIFNKLYFLFLLVFFWISKKDYFWFAFVFIVITEPGLLFHGGLATDIHRIPFYNIIPNVSFDFYDLFFIFAFVKALLKGKRTKLIMRKPLILLLFYLIFLFLISYVYGTDIHIIISYLRKFTAFTLFISFPFLVYKKEAFFRFMHLVFPIVFLIAFSQLFWLYTGNNLYFFLTGKSTASIIVLTESKGYFDFIRPMSGGAMAVFFSFIFSLFLIEKINYLGKKSYLYLILILCFMCGFLTAIRSWIIMYSVVLFLYFLLIVKKKSRLLIGPTLVIILLFSSYLIIPRLKYSVDNSFRRLSTIEDLIQGDLTADGTLTRIDKRLPKVLKGFEQNPIFGWGFSKTYRKYADDHVGTFNLLLQVGIIGFIPFLLLWIRYFQMLHFTIKNLSNNNYLKNPLLVLIVTFVGILILQLTTFTFFTYDLPREIAYFTILFIFFSEFFVKEALKEERKLR